MSNLKDRAQNLRIRLARLRITRGITARDIAAQIEYTDRYLSAVLRGVYESEPLCDKLEARLNEIEADELIAA